MKSSRPLAFLCAALLCAGSVTALELPTMFSDHAVLQRGEPVPVWGWAEPGESRHGVLCGANERGDGGRGRGLEGAPGRHEGRGRRSRAGRAGKQGRRAQDRRRAGGRSVDGFRAIQHAVDDDHDRARQGGSSEGNPAGGAHVSHRGDHRGHSPAQGERAMVRDHAGERGKVLGGGLLLRAQGARGGGSPGRDHPDVVGREAVGGLHESGNAGEQAGREGAPRQAG